MTNIVDEVIEYIEENKVSTTEVADVLKKTGLLDENMHCIVPKKRAVGRLFYAPCFNESNWYLHYLAQSTPKNCVIYAESINCGKRALFGSLVAKYLIFYKQAKGIVTNGYVRDVHSLIKEEHPIWCCGKTPIGCFNKDTGMDKEYYEKRKKELEGAIIVADDSGVVIVKKEQLNQEFLDGLKRIENQEDIWFDCIDRRKYSTFETVCLRKYENE